MKRKPNFFHLSIPFSIVNGVVWGIAIMVIPLLAGSSMKTGLSFAMLNLGIGVGAVVWSVLSHTVKVRNLIFVSTLISFIVWGLILLFYHSFLVPLIFAFGFSAAGIFALASVIVTNTYDKSMWDKYISLMQALMTFGTVVGLIVVSFYPSPFVALPFLAVGFLSYLPLLQHHGYIVKHHDLHSSFLKPKMHFSEFFTGYFYRRLKVSHILHLKNKKILIINLAWILALLAAAPIYAIYPLLMKHLFCAGESLSSLVYAASTALGVVFFVVAGKISEKYSPFWAFNIGVLLYVLSFVLMILGYCKSFYLLGIVGFVLMVIAWSFISVGMNVGIVKLVDESKRAELLGLANTFQSLDNMAGGFLGGFIATNFGYSHVVVFSLFFSVIAIIVGVILLK